MILFLILLLFHDSLGVKPVWKTPISEPNPNANLENLKNHSNVAKRAQPNYYTRPEQVSIPDYRAPRQRIPPVPPPTSQQHLPPHQITTGGHFRPFAWVGPQPKAGSPQTSYYNQAPNKGQFPNGLPPLPPNWQQYPVQMIWIPDNAVGPQGPQGPGQYYEPPKTHTGSYGLYGPRASTEEPMKPSAQPESYTGTVAHSPAANPVETTVPYAPPNPYGGHQTSSTTSYQQPYQDSTGTQGGYQDQNTNGPYESSTHSYGGEGRQTQTIPNPYENYDVTHPTTVTDEEDSSDENENPYDETGNERGKQESTAMKNEIKSTTSSFRDFESTSSGSKSSGNGKTVNPTIRPGPQEPSGGGDTTPSRPRTSLPYDADGITTSSKDSEDRESSPGQSSPTDSQKHTPLFRMTTNPFEESVGGKTVPPVFLGSDEDDEEGPEDISTVTDGPSSRSEDRERPGDGLNSTPTPQEEEDEMMKNFFPRPVSSQAYQPPGHQPEDFTSHINVNFKKPKGSCATPPCRGVDTDKISLYKPDHDQGSGPTLVISNAAKDDATRAGYKPAPPPFINPYIPPPPPPNPEEEYGTPYTVPPSQQPFPTFGPATPPRTLVPPHNFPSPSITFEPEEEYHETTVETISPTAQTISTRYTAPPTTTTPRSVESTTTEEDTPEYVPPAIVHMTASTPSDKNPPTYVPLHPESSSVTPESGTRSLPPSEATTPATITRQPSFPTRASPPFGGNIPPETTVSPYASSSATDLPTTEESFTEIVTDRERTDSGEISSTPDVTASVTTEEPTTTGSWIYTTETTSQTSVPSSFPTLMTSENLSPTRGSTGSTPSSSSSSTDRFAPSESTTDLEVPTTIEDTTSTSTDRIRPSEFEYTTSPTPPNPQATTVTANFPTTEGPPGILPNTNPPPRVNPYAPPEGAPRVPNRLIGKPRILCLEDGISFEVKTILPLNGEVFANDRKRIPECQKTFSEDAHPKLFLPFSKCGVKNVGQEVDSRAQYHMQVVLIIDQGNGTNTLQSFMAQCVHQKVNYNKQVLPKRIEEALEELHLVPSKLEQKASMPNVQMQIVVDEGHHHLGAEVSAADIGMPLALKWSMIPESDAYGMHVRNCKVVDAVGRIEHTLIDEQGCSADLQIIDHPHYDTYHDTASAHMWAFKVPDMSSLQIKCDILICSNIKSSVTNTTSCEDIPSPPFCADVVTSPPNSILSDASSFIKHRRASVTSEISDMTSTQSVRTSICLSKTCRPDFSEDVRVCINTQLATTSTGMSVAFLLFAISFQIIARTKRD